MILFALLYVLAGVMLAYEHSGWLHENRPGLPRHLHIGATIVWGLLWPYWIVKGAVKP